MPDGAERADDAGSLDGRRKRWQEHNLTRRQVIIDAAIAVIERQTPGDEVHVQAVADEANMSRTVIYRHFTDRADLDRAVQRQICDDVGAHLLGALTPEGTAEEIVQRIVSAFVEWAVQHPTLFWFAQRELGDWGNSPLAETIEAVAVQIEAIMDTVVQALGAQLEPMDKAGLDPWVFGMIGAVFAAIQRWLNRPTREPDVAAFKRILSQTVWVQIDGMARTRGIAVPADASVADLLAGLGDGDDGEVTAPA
ncbi:MAG TPA: TetR/AcrR family transcriptional regulator [Nocardioides sp.]|nr:TetR/AcrR family transcriptional regulator [Nocardioides sp.]